MSRQVPIKFIRYLQYVLIKCIMNRKWLMAGYYITHSVFAEIGHRKRFREWIAVIPELCQAKLKFISRPVSKNRFQFYDTRKDFIVDSITRISKLQSQEIRASSSAGRWVGRFFFKGIKVIERCCQLMCFTQIPVKF